MSSYLEQRAAYYHEHGESDHVRRLEAALGEAWEPTRAVAERAGVSSGGATVILQYLAGEGRADYRRAVAKRPMFGVPYRHEWRRPC